jgi:hypothetical protein
MILVASNFVNSPPFFGFGRDIAAGNLAVED